MMDNILKIFGLVLMILLLAGILSLARVALFLLP